ncbi:fish-egg lectin-like [Heptranchias perlo]|uniref:fish-egg lectin-like n=1 Tax=Heptranchias perlo TaxID=212740 RepID=UPI00355A2079
MRGCIFLLLLLAAVSWGLICNRIDGRLKQIDAGNGQVFGVGHSGMVVTRRGAHWLRVPGNLAHVTVGPAGVWGVDRAFTVYKLVGGSWAIMAGHLKQIDAGGDQIIAGVSRRNTVFCASKQQAVRAASYLSPAYRRVPGGMKYYSCGPKACWGLNSAGYIYLRDHVSSNFCVGSHWRRIGGRLAMVEVGTDGSVYGINRCGRVYRRVGISTKRPDGTAWRHMNFPGRRFRHLSADLGILWLVEVNGSIIRCQ